MGSQSPCCYSDAISSGPLLQRIADIYLGDKLTPVEASPASTAVPKAVSVPPAQLQKEVGWYADASRGLLRVTANAGKLTVSDVEGDDIPFEMTPAGEHQFFVILGGVPMTRLEFIETEGGAHKEMRVSPAAGGTPQVFQKLNTKSLTQVELQPFTGKFRSDELDSVYLVEEREGRLVLISYGRPEIVLEATGPDAFSGSIAGGVRFSRDGRGAIEGFTLNRTAARGVKFQRIH